MTSPYNVGDQKHPLGTEGSIEQKVAAMCRLVQSGERGMALADDVLRGLVGEYMNDDRAGCVYPPALAVALIRAAAAHGDSTLLTSIQHLATESLHHKGWEHVQAVAQACLPMLLERAEAQREREAHDEELARLLRPVDDPASETLLRAAQPAGDDTLLRPVDRPGGDPRPTTRKGLLRTLMTWLKGSEAPQHSEEEHIERLRCELRNRAPEYVRHARQTVHMLVLEVGAGTEQGHSLEYALAVVKLVRAYGDAGFLTEMQRLGAHTPRNAREARIVAAAQACCESLSVSLEAEKLRDEHFAEEARRLLLGEVEQQTSAEPQI